jgi:hypothetical protein
VAGKDLKVGDKAVIHATGPEEKLVAATVRFGTMTKDNIVWDEGDGSQPSVRPSAREPLVHDVISWATRVYLWPTDLSI